MRPFFEEVAFGARNFGTPVDFLPKRVQQALTEVGLSPELFWNRSPFTLSGGQKRRVCLASILVTNPQVLVLDEPSAGLDEKGRRWVADLVRRLNQQGKTVLWITHDMEEAAEVAQRIIVLKQGRVLLDGTPFEVFQDESLLREAHLALPPAAKLVRRLKERGVAVPGAAITIGDAYEEIRRWLEFRPYARNTFSAAEEVLRLAALARKTMIQTEEKEQADALWEQRTAEELRALVQREKQEQEPEPTVEEIEPPQPVVDWDLHGLTGEESPAVPAWKDGEQDV